MGSIILAEAIAAEPSFLPEGWEIKVVAGGDEPDAPAPGGRLLAADDKTGEVTAIVGVTGIVDHVNDLIEPGAYKDTLAKRRPKVCWAHSWEIPVGKVLAIEEWLPGDPRFKQVGATLDGKPWPAAAGALVARTQFNLKSDKGREAFAAVEFYSETGECEWSIGWQTVPGHTARRKDGVRVCKKVELYEVSPVLFGAAPLTRTLQVKSIRLDDAYSDQFERKAGRPFGVQRKDAAAVVGGAGDDDDENELHRLAADEIDWAEVEAASDLTGQPADDDHEGDPDVGDRLGLGPAGQTTDVAPPKGHVKIDAKSLLPFAGGDLADLDLDALAASLTQVKVDTPGDGNKGNARALINSYEHGKLAARIRWGQPGDFGRCVDIAGKHMTPDQAKGFCNLRHHGALGVYPGQEHGKSLGVQAAETLAKTWNPLLEVGSDAAHTERKYIGDGRLRGTFEQRREALDRALTDLLRAELGIVLPEDGTEPIGGHAGFVSIEGTWDDRVVASYVRFTAGSDERRTFEVPYIWDGEHVELGEPRPVELQVSVVPAHGPGSNEDVEDALVEPLVIVLGDGVDTMKAALARAPEVKAGRVLSEANIQRIRGALEHLLEVARSAGIELPGWTGTDPDPAQQGGTPDTTAPGTSAARTATPVPPASTPTAVKTLSLADVQADLAALTEGQNFLS